VVFADLIAQFPNAVRAPGAALYRADLVKIVHSSGHAVFAEVGRGVTEKTAIEVLAGDLTLACTCPTSRALGTCEHLWATVLTANEDGLLRRLPEFERWRRVGDRDRLAAGRPPPGPSSVWKKLLDQARSAAVGPRERGKPFTGEILYVVDAFQTGLGALTVRLLARKPRKLLRAIDPTRPAKRTAPKAARIPFDTLDLLPDENDRVALPLLQGAAVVAQTGAHLSDDEFATEIAVPSSMADQVMPLLSGTGRLFLGEADSQRLSPLTYDGGAPWEFVLRLDDSGGEGLVVTGTARRGDESVALTEVKLVSPEGWLVRGDRLARFRHFDAAGLASMLRKMKRLTVPAAEVESFMADLLDQRALPRLDLPAALALQEIQAAPRPEITVRPPEASAPPRWMGRADVGGEPAPNRPVARLAFSYQGRRIEAGEPRGAVALAAEGLLIRRDRSAEQLAGERLLTLGFRIPYDAAADAGIFDIAPSKLPAAVRTLLLEGWQVEADGRLYRRPGRFDIAVQSGIDWFDLSANVDFGGVSASLPDLLRALRRGEKTIVLGDGSLGMLPEEWLARYGLLAQMGTVDGQRLRFRRSQTGLLDALISAQPDALVDEIFARARQEVGRFQGVAPQKAPPGFGGELRPYQEVGVGWFDFLRRFGFGGCLADDMGLGKTIQILALLEQRRTEVERPSLVVVPKSLVWNWQQEAARFTPGLRCLAHVGPGRATGLEGFAGVDLVVTTYGTLRSDVGLLAGMEFDYLILDEAQAIKNPASESAKAARLLRGQHRLALSGTPVENHLGELWSLFEFLNPGMLGSTRAFEAITGRGRPSEESLAALARALRPFILRRTKAEVAPELPPKHEETIMCELDAPQARLYRDLREHYRARLLGGAAGSDGSQGKIQVLEALLRLRQAACHPGLIDARRADESSAKLDVLLPRLAELRAEGHKALVFSQFTSFLALVRARLDAEKVIYEYLDGQVDDRAARVTRFQTDPDCPLFLISLKAGGVGLNLTAADYVFILDPWWNPAVEAQAVDRTHRIGQERQVFVYRLLCRDTVEEKVAALQESKRGLADSIINDDQGFVRGLDRETLEILLS
jgi:hypothetical protein